MHRSPQLVVGAALWPKFPTLQSRAELRTSDPSVLPRKPLTPEPRANSTQGTPPVICSTWYVLIQIPPCLKRAALTRRARLHLQHYFGQGPPNVDWPGAHLWTYLASPAPFPLPAPPPSSVWWWPFS